MHNPTAWFISSERTRYIGGIISLDGSFRVGLILFVFLVYSPSLRHSPRADQWSYLVDTMHHPGLLDAIASTYSYNRTRQTMPCDTDLFRPLVFVVLAAERSLLKGDQASIQGIGICLHCGVCLLLLSLMRKFELLSQSYKIPSPSLLPYVFTAFFAFNPAIQELVIWAHLQGYLLFLVFVLGSLRLLLHHLSGPSAGRLSSPTLLSAWALVFLSAFTHEIGQIYAVFAGIFLANTIFIRSGIARAMAAFAVFASILPIYQAVNVCDLEIHRGSYQPDNNRAMILDKMFTAETLSHSARFVVFTAMQPFCPSSLESSFIEERVCFEESVWHDVRAGNIGPGFICPALVVCSILYLGMAGFRSLIGKDKRSVLLCFLIGGCLYGVYAGIIVLGRMNLKPNDSVLSANSYYTYTALSFGLLTAFSLCCGVRTSRNQNSTICWIVLYGGLIGLTLVGAIQIRFLNAELAEITKDVTTPIHAANSFIREHCDEPDFSLEIDHEQSDPIPLRQGRWVTEIVFARWIKPSPQYRITIRGDEVLILWHKPFTRHPGEKE